MFDLGECTGVENCGGWKGVMEVRTEESTEKPEKKSADVSQALLAHRHFYFLSQGSESKRATWRFR